MNTQHHAPLWSFCLPNTMHGKPDIPSRRYSPLLGLEDHESKPTQVHKGGVDPSLPTGILYKATQKLATMVFAQSPCDGL